LDKVTEKIAILASWIKQAKHVVLHTGAGISTSSGIPDFRFVFFKFVSIALMFSKYPNLFILCQHRGPNGVWTLEKKGLKPQINISFDDAEPTFTHMSIVSLLNSEHIHYIVSQNIDGLHLKSGLDRTKISELHGNMFIGQCNLCSRSVAQSILLYRV